MQGGTGVEMWKIKRGLTVKFKIKVNGMKKGERGEFEHTKVMRSRLKASDFISFFYISLLTLALKTSFRRLYVIKSTTNAKVISVRRSEEKNVRSFRRFRRLRLKSFVSSRTKIFILQFSSSLSNPDKKSRTQIQRTLEKGVKGFRKSRQLLHRFESLFKGTRTLLFHIFHIQGLVSVFFSVTFLRSRRRCRRKVDGKIVRDTLSRCSRFGH